MEQPKNFQSAQKPATDKPLQGGVIILPNGASNLPQTNVRPNDKIGDDDKTKGNIVETASSNDGNKNTASQPPKDGIAAPKSEPAQK